MSRNSFDNCREVERRSLEILRPFIAQHSINGQYVLVEKGRLAKELQQSYGDAFMNGSDGAIRAVELKAEEENRHQNLFIELWSNRARWNTGWIYKLNATVLMYHFVTSDELYVMSFEELRRWLFWHENGQKLRIYRYPVKLQSRHQQMNDTWGACIPISHIRNGLRSFRQFIPSTGGRIREQAQDMFGGHAA